jgi:hypothetical protein
MITAETAENAEIQHSLCDILTAKTTENAEMHDRHNTLVNSAISAHSAVQYGCPTVTYSPPRSQRTRRCMSVASARSAVHYG